MSALLEVVINAISAEARHILALELTDPHGHELPPFSPGAHLEIHLPNGLIRHYSLHNDWRERQRYCVGVGLAVNSRGGSRLVHGSLRVGDRLRIAAPRNNFPLVEDGQRYDFIAGGIGITPILAMVRWCQANGKDWHLHYLARSRLRAAFLEEFQQLDSSRVSHHFLDENAGQSCDIGNLIANIPLDSQIYCCGPTPLMERVQECCSGRPVDHVHFEWFSAARAIVPADNDAFSVVIHSTGASYIIPPDRSILDVLEDNGVQVPFSCREGICASCETRVLSGIPEHHDYVLSDAEKASGRSMLICVSRAKTPVLELDI
ncbi:PDR/VanB family oxidoreductase [Pseudomonas sp. FME51]|uniref:PDR/VanB family oxidoreductase n=1 Tax=Pseudomonas sp. FME51 TaxID=2742609 RepID=UPI0018680958|nr:PDR/VanB family oxidoreductase [Pseudomonas sp. FME51]